MVDLTVGRKLIPEAITKAQFDAALGLYPSLIARISEEKKNVGKSLGQNAEAAKRSILDLDKLRFDAFPKKYAFAKGNEVKPLEKDDVVLLVEWKLKHGTFRPGLLQMARNNPASLYTSTTKEAFEAYQASSPPGSSKEAIKILSTIKGIGPATASLLLSIHDPDGSIFFSDEAFVWLCRGGIKTKGGIKYNAKEFEELDSQARKLMSRLGVQALQVEKVAFVVMRDDCGGILEGVKGDEEIVVFKDDAKVKELSEDEGSPAVSKSSTTSGARKRKAVSPPEQRSGTRSSARVKDR